jgi:hypothetical protein
MGLDQYVYIIRDGKEITEKINFEYGDEYSSGEEFQYWRKHYDLDDWMFNLYKSKGGDNNIHEFDCVILDKDDLTELKDAIENCELPHRKSFDWSSFDTTPRTEEQKAQDAINRRDFKRETRSKDLEFCNKALEALEEGYQLFYHNDW